MGSGREGGTPRLRRACIRLPVYLPMYLPGAQRARADVLQAQLEEALLRHEEAERRAAALQANLFAIDPNTY